MAFDPDAYLATEDKKKGFDPDAYLAQPTTTARKEQGKAFASLADTALNATTGLLDMAAYPLANYYYGSIKGMPAEQAAARAQAETTSPKDVIGRAFGYTGQPSYESSPLRQLGAYAGEALGENVITPMAQSTGIPEPSVANMVNWGTLGLAPAIPKVVKPVARAAYDVSGGAFGAATGRTAAPGVAPKPWQQASVRQPVGETYLPADVLEQYRSGQLTAEQAQALARPTSELSGLAATGGTVPYAGQGMRAFGESLGETYRNPLNIITDVGAGLLSGGPAFTAGRLGYKGYQAYNANKLSNLGFTPLSSAEKTALRPGGGGGGGGGGIAGPITPQSMAADNINPVGATPAAQAAINTAIRPDFKPTPATPESTASIASALQNKVAANPALERYTKPYVVAEHLDEPINNFLNGWQRNALAYGPPGTGKTSLAYEWKAKNPQGTLEYLDANTFNAAEAQKLNNSYFTRDTPTLYVIDEADKFTKAQQKDLKALMDTTKQNGRVLATSNAPDKVPEFLKTPEFAQLDVNPRLTPEAKSTYALNVAKEYNVNLSPVEIESIAQNPSMQSFRDIKREISRGYSKKESPMFPRDTSELASDIPSTGLAQLDDFVNNKSSKNILIVDKQAFANDPRISEKLNKLTHVTDLDSNSLTNMLASPTTMSDTVRVVIRDKTDAAKLSRLKGLIERNNESRYPTNIIVEDLHGKLDDAIISRGDALNLTKLPSEQAAAVVKPVDKPKPVVEQPVAPVEQPPAPYDKAAQIKAAEASAKESFNNSTPEQNQAIRDTLRERNPDITFTTPDPLPAPKPVVETPPTPKVVKAPAKTTELVIPKVKENKAGVAIYGEQNTKLAEHIINESLKNNKGFEITYKKKGDKLVDYFDPKGFSIKFDPSLTITRRTFPYNKNTMTAFGKDADGNPVRLNFPDTEQTPMPIEVYVTKNGKEVLDRTTDANYRPAHLQKPKKTKPVDPDIFEMKTDPEPFDRPPSTVAGVKNTYPTKEAFDYANVEAKIRNENPTGAYVKGNKIIEWHQFGPTVEFSTPRAYDVKTGKRVPIGEKWTADDMKPEPTLREKLEAAKKKKGK